MVIDSQTYKYEACSITQEECTYNNCRECETAKDYIHMLSFDEKKEELNRYTKFERESHIMGLTVMVESGSVIAKTDKPTLEALQDKGVIFKSTIPYHPDNLRQYAIHLKKLRKYQRLGIPDEIWASKNYPAAFRWGNIYFLIAPRIESE